MRRIRRKRTKIDTLRPRRLNVVICNRCKKDPVETEPNEALKAAPWGIVITPPPASGLSERRYCLRCTIVLFDALVAFAEQFPSMLPPQ